MVMAEEKEDYITLHPGKYTVLPHGYKISYASKGNTAIVKYCPEQTLTQKHYSKTETTE